jgi:hypothetical protein
MRALILIDLTLLTVILVAVTATGVRDLIYGVYEHGFSWLIGDRVTQ